MRVPAAIWSTEIAARRVSNEWMHITDILPTLAAAANVSLGYFEERMDGMNHWPSLTSGFKGPRTSILHNIDDIFGYKIIVDDGWKLIYGSTNGGEFDRYMGNFIEPDARMNATYYFSLVKKSKVNQALKKFSDTPLDSAIIDQLQKQATVICQSPFAEASECNPLDSPCLFNLNIDPCENNNLAKLHPDKVAMLSLKLNNYALTAEAPRNKPRDSFSDPRYHNGTWTYWWDDRNEESAITNNKILWISIGSITTIAILLLFIGGTLIIKSTHEHNKTKESISHN